jgi:microcystin-dependent protein
MSDPFVAEVRAFGFDFPPSGWATCDGQLLKIAQNTALFSLLGTNYGGDGQTTFGLPSLAGRAVVSSGQGPGLSAYVPGEHGGSEEVTLFESQLPSHTHSLNGLNSLGDSESPMGGTLGRYANAYQQNTTQNLTAIDPSSLGPAGADDEHNNMMAYLPLLFCIAIQGIFPQR